MNLEHAHKSAGFARTARVILNSVRDEGEKGSQDIVGLIPQIENLLNETTNDKTPWGWCLMDAGLRVLASQSTCRQIARGGEGNLQEERLKLDVLTGELKGLLSPASCPLPDGLKEMRQTLLGEGDCDGETLSTLLLALPLPTLYWRESSPLFPYPESYVNSTVANPMVRLITFLDGNPIASPHLLRPNLLYSLEFHVRGVNWPDDAPHFHLKLSSTCPPEEYSLSGFVLDRPSSNEDDQFEGKLKGNISFKSGQSSLLEDLVFAVHGAFETDRGTLMEVPVIGHGELRLRVTSESGYPIASGNRPVDRHLMELISTVVSHCPAVRDEMPELLELLPALARLVATYAQGAIYKGESNVSESDFQSAVVKDLRLQLGQNVQEHTSQAGGITDIRYRGAIVELKVERENGDRAHLSQKYTSQVAQYAGVEARQVSVLLVLDLTPKEEPPGDIRDDIILADVETHGGDDSTKKFPSKALIFIVNGNTKSPSVYSN